MSLLLASYGDDVVVMWLSEVEFHSFYEVVLCDSVK